MKTAETIFESLDFTSDLIFKHVLNSDIDLCKEIIRRIAPDIDTEGIQFAEPQHEVIVGPDKKTIMLDVLVRNDHSRTDLEMFRYRPRSISKTCRYNASMIDSDMLKRSDPYELPDVTVILFCTYDPFGYGEPVYRFCTMSPDHPDYEFQEGRQYIIITNQGYEKAAEEIKPIIYLLTRNPEPIDDPLYKRVQRHVNEIKTDLPTRRAIMNQIEKEYAIREEGLEAGREVGREEGRKEGRNDERKLTIRKLLRRAHAMKQTEEEIREMLADLYPGDEEMIREVMATGAD